MDIFNENGKYIETDWKTGDRITAPKLNKIEDAIDVVNAKTNAMDNVSVDLSEYATKVYVDSKVEEINTNDSINAMSNARCNDGDSYIHMSFDDVTSVITTLARGSLNSIYDNEFLSMLKNMHDSYGFVFSLYIQTLPSSISTKYQTELQEASSWLKWGIHALNGGNYANSTYKQGKDDWNNMVDVILMLTGTHNAIDRIPRLHQFYGSEAALQGMRDANLGAKGFLSSDDTRNAYYLPSEQLEYLYEGENDHITDFKNSLIFYRTDLRLDWFANAGFIYNTANGMRNHAPTDDSDITGELEIRFNNSLYMNTWDCFVIFTHEWQPIDAIESALINIGTFAKAHAISFDFPQNHQANICQGDISSVADTGSDIIIDTSLSTTSENTVQNKVISSNIKILSDMDTTLTSYINDLEARIVALESVSGVTSYNVSNDLTNVVNSNAITTIAEGGTYTATLSVVSDIYEMNSVIITMGGTDITGSVYADGAISIENVIGDIIIVASANLKESVPLGTYTFKNGNEVDIVSDYVYMIWQSGTSIAGTSANRPDQITYPFATTTGRAAGTNILKVNGGEAIILNQVITDLAYSITAFSDTNNTESSTDYTFKSQKWITTNVTLPSNAQYILIAFRNGVGDIDFTEEELALLSNALTFE